MRTLVILSLVFAACDDDAKTSDMSAAPDLSVAPDLLTVDLKPPPDLLQLPDQGPRMFTTQTVGVPADDLTSVFAASPSSIYVVGNNGVSLHSAGNGTWVPQNVGAGLHLGVWGSSAAKLYVVGSNGLSLHATGNGTWNPQTSGAGPSALGAVWGTATGAK